MTTEERIFSEWQRKLFEQECEHYKLSVMFEWSTGEEEDGTEEEIGL